jgi:hypothetical protein
MKEKLEEGKLAGVRGAVNSVVEGARRVLDAIAGGGVRREDWPRVDQERLLQGDRPQGHPEHPNV